MATKKSTHKHAHNHKHILAHRHAGMCIEGGLMACCASYVGVVHMGMGAGVGFLIVHYAGLANLATWGWTLVILGVLAHFISTMKCHYH